MNKLQRVFLEIDNPEPIETIYARYSNQLRVEADCGVDEELFSELTEIVASLERVITARYMKEHGYYSDENDDFGRWKRMLC